MTTDERESQRQERQSRFDRSRDPESRNRSGQFATPIALADSIARELWRSRMGSPSRDRPARLLDPAVGIGAFYSAALRTFPHRALEFAVGVETDPELADEAQALWGPLGLQIARGDFTKLAPPDPLSSFNVMIVNPPYVRHHYLESSEKTRLKALIRDRLGLEVSGLSGLHAWFLLAADSWLEPGGVAAWLVPSEFMEVNYGEAIRRYLSERVTLRRVHRFAATDEQFADALVTSAVLFFEKTTPEPNHGVEFSEGGTIESPASTRRIAATALRAARKWPPPLVADDSRLSVAPQSSQVRLGDIFDVRRGIATGANDFFILEYGQAERLGLPDLCLRPILPSPRELIVERSTIESDPRGRPLLPRSLAVLDCDLSEPEIRERHPGLWSYLEQGKRAGIDRRYLTSRRTPWHSQERRAPAPLLCSYMGRGSADRPPFRVFLNRSQAIASNVWLMLYPKGIAADDWRSDPEAPERWLKRLQSIRPEQWIEQGRVYGGGLRKLEPSELAKIALPTLPRTIDSKNSKNTRKRNA